DIGQHAAALCRERRVLIIWLGLVDVSGIRNFRAIRRIALTIAMSALFAACSLFRPAQVPTPPRAPAIPVPHATPTPQVVGMASWYGPGFHGHKNAAGGFYDQ